MLLYGASSPADAWIDNGDGTATHTVTGLMWMRAALGQTWLGQTWTGTTCIGDPKKYSPNEAKEIGHHFAGYIDWRVPTINELMSIVDLGDIPWCIDQKIFPNHGKEDYLSNSCFKVDFSSGMVINFDHTKHGCLRMVRSLSTALSLEKKTKFHNNNDGTATDVSTGLTWMRCALGQIWDGSKVVGEPYLLTYQNALSIHHTFASFDDWRVPSIGELNSIVDRGKKTRCADEKIFTNIVVVGKVLSSTLVGLVGSTGNYYYCINLVSGNILFTKQASIILLVRGEYQSSSLASGKSPISISSDNKTKSHQLNINKFGSGSGSITCTPNETSHAAGSLVTLSAIPETGSKFMGWLGDITESAPTFSFAMNSAKTVIAHFARLSFPLVETITGTRPETLLRIPTDCAEQQSRSFTLVNAIEEAVQASVEESIAIASSPDMAAMLLRIETLEAGLSEALRKLDALQTLKTAPPAPVEIPANVPARAQTLPDILTWLATQERVSLAVLRQHLLPLDLLPSAVIDEINERALDLSGDIAFEEVGEEIIIAKEVLFEVLAN
jgi:hypothetical protein